MAVSVIAYNNLKISPYELTNLTELKIVKKINEHTKLHVTGVIPENQKDSYVNMTECETAIEVNQSEDSQTVPLFKGIVSKITVKAVQGIYYLDVEAVSYTYNMDIKLNSRSFQNKNMTYRELVSQVTSSYKGADTIFTVPENKSIEKLIIQYNETDWQFLKRIASEFNTGLVAGGIYDSPKFYFGIPDSANSVNLDNYNYTVSKKISDFRSSSENYIDGIDENDFIYYEVETDKLLNIGEQTEFLGKNLLVYNAVTSIENGILKHIYTLSPKKGLSQNKIYNNQFIGLSIHGTIIDVSKDQVRVKLNIDNSQNKDEAWWFGYSSVYTAEGNSGWYCMPELNDQVRIYFPDNKEEDGIAVSSVRLNSDGDKKLSNPDVKYFRTKSGR